MTPDHRLVDATAALVVNRWVAAGGGVEEVDRAATGQRDRHHVHVARVDHRAVRHRRRQA